MAETKMRVGSVETLELQVRIPCRGKSAAQVLDDVQQSLADAEAQGRDPLLVFEDLGRLEGSVATLLKDLCRLLVGYPRTVSFWESSGYAEAFLSVLEAA